MAANNTTGRSRLSRRRRIKVRRRTLVAAGAIASAIVAIGAVAALLTSPVGSGPANISTRETPLPDRSLAASDGAGTVVSASAGSTLGLDVIVPDVTGKDLATAEMMVEALDLTTVTRVSDVAVAGATPDTVVGQDPVGGQRVAGNCVVTLFYQPVQSAAMEAQARVVVIDPGHQAKADLRPEAIGPGSALTKERIRAGATGVATGIPEHRTALAVGLRLRERLQAGGVKVVMTRSTSDANVSNKQRALIGNHEKADLVVRVHFDASTDSRATGVSTLYPGGNSWVKPITVPSRRAAGLIQTAVVSKTGARNRGVFASSDMTGFNWSKVPTVIVEGGFLSNPVEDRKIASDAHQDKIAAGMAAGILEYLDR